MMDRGGRESNENFDNGYYGGATLGRRKGGKLKKLGTKKNDGQCGEGMTINQDKKPCGKAGEKKVDFSAETAPECSRCGWRWGRWCRACSVISGKRENFHHHALPP
jgi:hypothetical protein